MAWYLFNWKTGNILREFETESDKILLDSRGDDSITASVPYDSLTPAQKRNWRNDFCGVKMGIAYTEHDGDIERVVAAGQLSETPSLRNGLLNLSAHGMKTHLENLFYENGTSITKNDAKFTHTGTGASYINALLDNISARTHTVTFGAPSGSGGSRSSKWVLELANFDTVADVIDDVADQFSGVEMRFDARLIYGRIEFFAHYGESTRLFNSNHVHYINLSDPDTKLISIEPTSEFGDFHTALWHEIDIAPTDDPDLDRTAVDIKKTSVVVSDFAEIAKYESFGSELTPTERAEQVDARLSNNSKPFDRWEVEVFSEGYHDSTGTFTTPIAWNDASTPGYLGARVNLDGTDDEDYAALKDTLRCIAIQFSSHDPLVIVQLADVRSIYPKMRRRVTSKKKDREPKKPNRLGEPGDPVLPPYVPPVPDPTKIPTAPDWDWGNEPNPFDGMKPSNAPIYGIEMGQTIFTNNPWNDGSFPKGAPAPDFIGSGTYLFPSIAWGQDTQGNGIYGAFFDKPADNIQDGWQDIPGYDGNFHGWGIFVKTKTVGEFITWKEIVPPLVPSKLVITSGKLERGNIVDLNKRAEIVFDRRFMEQLIFKSDPQIFDAEKKLESQVTGVLFLIESIHVFKENIMVMITVSPHGSGATLRRIINIKKGVKYNDIDASAVVISPTISHVNHEGGGVYSYAHSMGSLRVSNQVMVPWRNQHSITVPMAQDNLLENWKAPLVSFSTLAFATDQNAVKFPSIISEDGLKAFSIDQALTNIGQQTNHWGTVATDSTKESSMFSRGMGLYTPMSIIDYTIAYQYRNLNPTECMHTMMPVGTDGFSFVLGNAVTNLTKNKNGEASTFSRMNESGGRTIFDSGSITAFGTPLNIRIAVPNGNFTEMSVRVEYYNRSYSQGSTPETQFSPAEYGTEFPATGGTVSSPFYTYGNRSLIPRLSYEAKRFPVMASEELMWQKMLESLQRRSLTTAFYYDGYLYILPNVSEPSTYMQTENNLPARPPMPISIELDAKTTAHTFWGGDQIINKLVSTSFGNEDDGGGGGVGTDPEEGTP